MQWSAVCLLYLIRNSPAVKKSVWPPRMPLWRKMWNPRWQPWNGCDGRLIAKIIMTTIQVNLCCLFHVSLTNLPQLSLLKFLLLTYHHSHFLAATLDFTSFFTMAFLEDSWAVLGLDLTSFVHVIVYKKKWDLIPQSWHIAIYLMVVVTYLLFFSGQIYAVLYK